MQVTVRRADAEVVARKEKEKRSWSKYFEGQQNVLDDTEMDIVCLG